MTSWASKRLDKWLTKRIPVSQQYQLDVNNTFILPTRFGWAMTGLMLCLFILGTNYQNNVILMFCYFVFAVLLLSIFHSYVSFVQYHLRFSPIQANFANQDTLLNLHLKHNPNRSQLHSLSNIAAYRNNPFMFEYLNDDTNTLTLGRYKRGQHSVGRLSIESIFPFGLFRCWTHLTVPGKFMVYPAPLAGPLKIRQQNEQGKAGKSDNIKVSSDDLQGLREYRDTDPIHHVSWKHFAKGQGLLTRDFNDNAALNGWLYLSDYLQGDVEQALSLLAYQIIELGTQDATFGLSIGNQQIMPSKGPAHQAQCLEALALYKHQDQVS